MLHRRIVGSTLTQVPTNSKIDMPVIVVFLGVLSLVTSGSKNDITKTKAALKDLKNLLKSTVTTMQGQINTINGKITALDNDLIAIEVDFKKRLWMKYKDHCYFFGTEKVIWTIAERRCREIGGYLAKIDDANENTWAYRNMAKVKKNTHFWIGMTDVSNGDWRWIYDETKPKYTKWYSKSPANSKDNNCVVALYQSQYAEQWYDDRCTKKHGYLCENNFCFS